MANKKELPPQANEQVPTELPPGVKLLRTLEGHTNEISSLCFDPRGDALASAGYDDTIKLWDARSGKLLRTLTGHERAVYSLVFDPTGNVLASGSGDGTLKLWNARSGKLLRVLAVNQRLIYGLAFDKDGDMLASAGSDTVVRLWSAHTGELLRTLDTQSSFVFDLAFSPQGNILACASSEQRVMLWYPRVGRLDLLEAHKSVVSSVAFDPRGITLVSGSFDKTVKVWGVRRANLLRTLEGHTSKIEIVRFSSDGRLLFSKSDDQSIRIWNCATWETVAVIPAPTSVHLFVPALAVHPTLPLLASPSSAPDISHGMPSREIYIWELDYDVLLRQPAKKVAAAPAVHHTTGKIVLLGDHSVGKSALGHRLINGGFKEQASTHGQQFWVFPALGKHRSDGTQCEAILWDFAGQPDYRLVHALFVDNADLALVLFDASDIHDPLHGVGFWLKQLKTNQSRCPIILVAAQSDRGSCPITHEELNAFCKQHAILGPIVTSAQTGAGIDELVESMRSVIAWEDKPATVTTATFKRIKDYVLGLKEAESQNQIIVTPEELRALLEATDPAWEFSDDEMLTAVEHLENYGYVRRLRTSKGGLRVLLQPERLNNLASSLVLEARRNPKGLGALEEKRLLAHGYDFPEVRDLEEAERDVLLDSAALLFLEHNVCFRETDPLRMEPYLVFPELINLKKPLEETAVTEDGVAYTVSGPTENLFASLVVLLGYTNTFVRTTQWQNNARYEVGDGLVCGFRQEAAREGELDFVLCFGPNISSSVQILFQGLFESFLARRNVTVRRFEPLRCSKNHLLNRMTVMEAMLRGDESTFCSRCGERQTLPAMAEPIQLTQEQRVEVEAQRRTAEQRTGFEQAVFRLHAYITDQKIPSPKCFISYAWGVPEHERWVEKRLATDLQKMGVDVLLDRWDNAQIGASIARFVERIEECDRVIVVGTPSYRQKAKNLVSAKGSVVAAEYDLTGIRLLATEDDKRTVLPVLLAGEENESFPPLLRGRVYADFRNDEFYFQTVFDLILSIYELPVTHPAVADLRVSLRPETFRG